MKVRLNTNSIPKTDRTPSLSFKGIYNNKVLLKTLKYAAKNGTMFSAGVSLGLSTIARPIAIMSTPKTDKENKKHACAKSIASSAVGFGITTLAANPIVKAVEKIDKAPSKYLKQSTIKSLKNNAKTLQASNAYGFATQLFKLGIGLVMAVPKSFITCTLIPPIIYLISGNNNKQKPQTQKQQGKVISFKGIYDSTANRLAKHIGKLIDKKPLQEFAKKYHDTNYAQHMMNFTDILLTASFIGQTAKSKKIKNERKKPLIHNSLISTALCISGGYAINAVSKKHTDRFIEKFKEANKNLPELEKYVEGIKIVKPVMILGGIYYIIIPIISTFLADRTGGK